MYTKCSECSTVFRISDAQLLAANGKVRCGHCKHVFNALDRLLLDVPTGEPALGGDASPYSDGTEHEFDIESIELSMPDESPPQEHITNGELTSGEWQLDSEAEPAVAEDAWGEADDEFEMPAPSAEPETPLSAGAADEDENIEVVSDEDSASIVVPPPSPADTPPPVIDTRPHVATHDDIPPQLRESLQAAQAAPANRGRIAITSVAALLLLGVLGVQLLIFAGTQLAASAPSLSPFIASACQVLPCRIGGRRDLDKLQLANRDIRADAAEKGVLIITATIVNTAEFRQPFPDLLVILSNLAGDVVAQRRFVPAEYLGELGEKLILMAPNKPVSVALEVLDPGNDAVNFEFALL